MHYDAENSRTRHETHHKEGVAAGWDEIRGTRLRVGDLVPPSCLGFPWIKPELGVILSEEVNAKGHLNSYTICFSTLHLACMRCDVRRG